MDLLPVVLGLFTGLVLGLTGAGGGVLAGPLLMLVLHLPLAKAAPISLVAVALAAGLATVMGLRQGQVRYRAALLMSAMGIAASPLGIALSRSLPEQPLILCFAALLIYQARRQWRGHQDLAQADRVCAINSSTGRFLWDRPCARAMAGAGLLAGFFSGLLGVGGGFILVPALSRHTPLPMTSVTATSLMVLTLVSLAGLAQWASHGAILWSVGLPFMVGTVAGLTAGRLAAPRIADHLLRRLFAGLVASTALALLARLLWPL